jgi:hypothetical protein
VGARVRDRVGIGRARRDGRTRGDAGGGEGKRAGSRARGDARRARGNRSRGSSRSLTSAVHGARLSGGIPRSAPAKKITLARGRNAAECDAARDSRVDRAGSNDRSGDSRRRVIPRGVRSDALCASSARSSRSSIAILTDAHTKTVIARAGALARSAPLRNTRILLSAGRAGERTTSRASDEFVTCCPSAARSEQRRVIFVSHQKLANSRSPPWAFFPPPPALSRPSFASSASASARFAPALVSKNSSNSLRTCPESLMVFPPVFHLR